MRLCYWSCIAFINERTPSTLSLKKKNNCKKNRFIKIPAKHKCSARRSVERGVTSQGGPWPALAVPPAGEAAGDVVAPRAAVGEGASDKHVYDLKIEGKGYIHAIQVMEVMGEKYI